MITKEKVDIFLSRYEEIKKVAEECLKWYHTEVEKVDGYDYLDFNSFDDGYIYFEGDEYWAYGGHEHYSFSLSIKLLYDQEYRDKLMQTNLLPASLLMQTKKEKQEEERKKILLKQQEQKKEEEEKEKELYLKLKEKYGKKD